MKRISNKTIARLAAAGTSSVAASAVVQVLGGNKTASVLTGVAVLSSQVSDIVGTVGLGTAISRGQILTSKSVGKLQDDTLRSLSETRASIAKSLTAAAAGDQKLFVDEIASRVVAAMSTAAGKSKTKIGQAQPQDSADPKSRRTHAPAPAFTHPKLLSERANAPIAGEQAKFWIESRTGGAQYQVEETSPAFRTGEIPFATDVPVAMIADEFTYHSFKDEFNTVRLMPNTWKKQFEQYKPQLFFCESAWQGGPPADHPWQAKIYASVRWPRENRTVLLDILDYCHKKGIPTVFWNKEDPTHFSDRINDFARTAGLFDYVFTTAEECIPSYIKDVGVKHVDVLPFAVQPSLFNPQGIGHAAESVSFAGTWYGNYPDRCAAMVEVMDQVLDAGLELVIYDRMYGLTNPINKYPEKYLPYTRPAIPYVATADAYKKSRYGITMNTVTDSETMFARRVFELAASGAVVLSNSARGVKNFFGDSVIYADEDPGRLQEMTSAEYVDLQTRAMNVALDNTYSHRAETLLRTAGIDFQPRIQAPTGVVRIDSENQYDRVLTQFKDSQSIDRLLVAVSPQAEQSLEYKLGRRRDENVVVVNADSLGRGEYRTRSFLSTPAAILLDAEDNWLTVDEVAALQRHSSHFNSAITFSTSESGRYTTTDQTVQARTYLPAADLLSAFRPESTLPTFHV